MPPGVNGLIVVIPGNHVGMKMGRDGNEPDAGAEAGDVAEVDDDVVAVAFGGADAEDDAGKSIGIKGGGESNSSLSF